MDEKVIAKYIEKYTHKAPEEGADNPYVVWLDIDHQHFRMFEVIETAKQADWYRRQLAIALIRLTTERITPEDEADDS